MLKKLINIFVVLLLVMGIVACKPEEELIDIPENYTTIEDKVASWLRNLTIEQKVGQMLQAERTMNNGDTGITLQEVTRYNIGSVLNGGGNTPSPNNVNEWYRMYSQYLNASKVSSSKIPIIYGVDAVHGHNNLLNSTIFPHNIGLAAANNPDLMRRIGEVTAYEMALTGMNFNFSPSIGVIKDVRWGRTYETLGENPEAALGLIGPYIEGLQTRNIAATAKHFIGDSYTNYGTGIGGKIDQGDAVITEEDAREILLPLYAEAIDAGVKSIMISYSSINGVKMHQSKYWITDVLKGELGFKGFVISDYEATSGVTGNNFTDKIINTVNAGIDMLMEPHRFIHTIESILYGVSSGRISMERIDDAVGRILTVKYELGLFDNQERLMGQTRTEANLEVARQAVRESLVLLKNEESILPLSKNAKILLVGPGSDNIGIQSGGWTMYWQGGEGNITAGTTIKQAFESVLSLGGGTLTTNIADIDQVDVVVLVLAERPGSEMLADSTDLSLNGATAYAENVDLIQTLSQSNKPIVSIMVSGKPLIIEPYIDSFDAFVMAFLPGTEGLGISDVLFGDHDFKGTLPYTYPKTINQASHTMLDPNYDPLIYQFPYGFGLKYTN